jgi:hypothetical protein
MNLIFSIKNTLIRHKYKSIFVLLLVLYVGKKIKNLYDGFRQIMDVTGGLAGLGEN